jgi:hypothetical protein
MRETIDSVSSREREVRDKEGRWYSLRIRNVIRLDTETVGDLRHRHSRGACQDVGQLAFMVRIQVLHQHKSHPCVNRQVFEQLREGFQPARGCTDADDGKD